MPKEQGPESAAFYACVATVGASCAQQIHSTRVSLRRLRGRKLSVTCLAEDFRSLEFTDDQNCLFDRPQRRPNPIPGAVPGLVRAAKPLRDDALQSVRPNDPHQL